MWLTCYSLHKMLLEANGLHKNWENGVRSDWEISYNKFVQNGSQHNMLATFAIARLNRDIENEDANIEKE